MRSHMISLQTQIDRGSRKFFLLSLLLALLLVSSGATHAQTSNVASTVAPAAEWRRYRVNDGEFSVLLPAAPALSSYKSDGRFEPFENRIQHMIGAYYQGVGYGIYVFERSQSLDEFMHWSRNHERGEFKRNVKVSGMSGKEYLLNDSFGKSFMQFVVSKKRAYLFTARSSTIGNPDVEIPKFFQSISFDSSSEGNLIIEGPSEAQSTYIRPAISEGDDTFYTGRQVDQKARVVMKPRPNYTDEARRAQVTGTVVLRAVFTASGEVINIRAVSGLPHGLTERAVGTARQIKFIPPIKDGRFVSMYIQLEYNFNLY